MKFSINSLLMILFALTVFKTNIFTQQAELIKESTVSTEKGKTLTVSTFAGTIDVTTWERNEVEVKVTGNKTAEDIMVIDINNSPTGVKVDGQKNSEFKKKSYNLSLKYVIKVPNDYNVDAFTGGGGVSVKGLNGTVKINTSGGNIDLDNINGNIDGSTAGGNVTINRNTGTLDISTQGGNIKADGFNGKVKISSMGGNLNLSGTGAVNAHTGGGNITLDYNGNNEGIELSTMAGNIKLDLPSNIDADADISTLVGKITSDFASAENGKMSSFLKTKFNSGGNMLKCSTSAGNITVNKK